jgi:predicted lipoprotein with Yx(FWY)xxD motif
MRRSRITLAATAFVLAGAGGIAYAATAGGSGGNGYGSSGSASSPMSPAAIAAPHGNTGNQPTVRVATATVQGKTERILVDAQGMPLYTYREDTATTSRVSGQLAALWPPLVASMPTERGTSAPISSRTTSNGQQVTYQGHFLYTFVEDRPGRVTGQGVQDFFVATPSGQSATKSPSSTAPAPYSGY